MLAARARPRPLRLEADARAGAARPAARRAPDLRARRSRTRPTRRSSGTCRPEDPLGRPRPWWRHPVAGARRRHGGDPHRPGATFYDAARRGSTASSCVRLGAEPGAGRARDHRRRPRGRRVRAGAHDLDESLTANVLLENLACKASGVHALAHLLAADRHRPARRSRTRSAAARRPSATATSGAAATSRRRSPRLRARRARAATDVKAFCAAPVHALVVAGGAVEAGVERAGRRGRRRLARQARDEVRGRARPRRSRSSRTCSPAWPCSSAPADGSTARAAHSTRSGRHAGRAGAAQQARARGRSWRAARRARASGSSTSASTRPSSTTPRSPSRQGGGDVADRNYKMLAGARRGARRARAARRSPAFARAHGLPGFSPTQGHIARAVPWLPHALAGMRDGELRPNDADREGVAVPRPHDAAVGRRVRDPGDLRGDR